MNRMISWIMNYKGFVIAGILSAIIIAFYIAGEMTAQSRTGELQTGPLRFLSLAWQEDAVKVVHEITDKWNRLHPEQQVELIQGNWSAVHDFLITGFETGDIPDIFHYESAIIVDFALRDYLADLSPYISQEMREDILDVNWASVTRSSGEVIGIPFLTASSIVLYNPDLFAEAGVIAPTMENPWTWDDVHAAAKKLTLDRDGDGVTDQWGTALGLRNCANILMNLSISFGGSFFYEDDQGDIEVRVAEPEKKLIGTLAKMLFEDKTMAPSGVGKSGTEMLPGFLTGDYAMVVSSGAWARQQLVENAEEGFHWAVMPPIKAVTQSMGINTQTLSIPKSCTRQAVAMDFVQFLLSAENTTRLAISDWVLPTRRSSIEDPRLQDVASGWNIVSQNTPFLSIGPWVGLPGYVEWKSRVANPTFQEFFAGRMTIEEVAERIENESSSVMARYKVRGLKW